MARRKITAAALIGACLLACAGPAVTVTAAGGVNKGNIIIHNSYAAFKEGQCSDTAVLDKGNGVIELLAGGTGQYPTRGTYTSPEILTDPFEYLVLSWNTDTPYGTSVKIEAQVAVNGVWSKWLLVGTWSSSGDKASAMSTSQAGDDIAYVDTDIVTVKGSDGETADRYKYRLTLYTDDIAVTPTVRLIAAALRNTIPGQEIGKAPEEGDKVHSQEEIDAWTGDLGGKPYSQMVRDPQFNSIMCSAASSCMVLHYKGEEILPEMAAMGVLDTFYDGYGNWPFNAAFIGSYGYEAYIEYCQSFDEVKLELMAGNPVICSVRYKRDKSVDGDLPVISNAPIDRTFGHLLVVVGYEKDEDGKGWVIVNDPAAGSDGEVHRKYAENQFMSAWGSKLTYRVHEKVAGAGEAAPVIEEAVLVPTGRTKNVNSIDYAEYMIIGSETGLVSAAKAVNPHNPTFETGVSIVVWDDVKAAVHSYITPTRDPAIWLRPSQLDKTVYIFLKSGGYYKAKVQE